jgi:hypothetical protein
MTRLFHRSIQNFEGTGPGLRASIPAGCSHCPDRNMSELSNRSEHSPQPRCEDESDPGGAGETMIDNLVNQALDFLCYVKTPATSYGSETEL